MGGKANIMELNSFVKRDAENIAIYRKMYSFIIDKDLSVFHIVLDTDKFSKDDVIEIVCNISK